MMNMAQKQERLNRLSLTSPCFHCFFVCARCYITADYHLQNVVWHFCFSLLALHAWLAALEPLSKRDPGLF